MSCWSFYFTNFQPFLGPTESRVSVEIEFLLFFVGFLSVWLSKTLKFPVYFIIKKLEIACIINACLAIGAKIKHKIYLKISKIPPIVPKKSKILKTALLWIFSLVDGKIQTFNKIFLCLLILLWIPWSVYPIETKLSFPDYKKFI